METFFWNQLNDVERSDVLARAPQTRDDTVRMTVSQVIERVRREGDAALLELTSRFDYITLDSLSVNADEMERAVAGCPQDLRAAIDQAWENINAFHATSIPRDKSIETVPGVHCQTRFAGIHRVGLYVPGGATPLPSSVLMMGVPAALAGVQEVVLCTPPNNEGTIDSGVAYAALVCGIKTLFKVGGAQAIAAMAFGTESIPGCDKLFGPGSIWVTEAKRQVAANDMAVTIDMPAGPSEVLVLADETANGRFVAADLLAQMEHGEDSQAILVSTCPVLAQQVKQELSAQTALLERRSEIEGSLRYSRTIVAANLEEAVEISNRYAAEHLIIQTANPESTLNQITAAGSIFLGPWTPEVLGDYCSGTNHVLPTSGFARSVNGLSVMDFMKRITVQRATRQGLESLASTATTLAEWEGLTAHARAVSIRQEVLAEDKA